MATLVQLMAWRRIGNKPLSGAMLVCSTDAYMRLSASVSQVGVYILYTKAIVKYSRDSKILYNYVKAPLTRGQGYAAAYAKLYSSTSANNSILGGVEYIFIPNNFASTLAIK